MHRWTLAISCCSILSVAAAASAEDWSTWRGPRHDGTSAETGVPVQWSATENVRWKTPLPARGNSTPVIVGDHIYLTQATDGGKTRGVHCFDRLTGELVWAASTERDLDEPTHEGNPYCSSSVAVDAEAVYAWYGSAGVYAYSHDGETLWQRDLGPFTHIWGNASTPVVVGNLLILNCGPGERAFVVALDKATGETVWQADGVTGKKDAFLGSWSSPRLVEDAGRQLVLVAHPHALVAYDPPTGDVVWTCEGLTDLVYTTPIVGQGVACAMSGYTGKALAVRLGGTGNVTSERRLWITPDGKKEDQRIGSGIIHDGHIYMVNEPGFAQCIKLETGESLWRERVCATTWSSLVMADGRLYILDKAGTTTVFAAQPKLEVLAKNELGEPTNSSIAVSGGHLFIRTDQHLWCIGP